jgi:hypothetical protein
MEQSNDGLYAILSLILVAALVCDFAWVITTALSAH